jgi:hypothetical protein
LYFIFDFHHFADNNYTPSAKCAIAQMVDR